MCGTLLIRGLEKLVVSLIVSLCCMLLLLDGCERGLDEVGESCFVVNGHFGENLAIYIDISRMDGMHELAIANAVHTSSSVDARDPQTAHVALAIAAVSIHVSHRAHDRFMCGAIQAFACATMAFSHL